MLAPHNPRTSPIRRWLPPLAAAHTAEMPRKPRNSAPRTFLEALLQHRGVSQNKLAALLGKHAEEVGRIARGERPMTMEWATQLSPVLDVAVLDLIEGRRRRVPLEWHVASFFSEDRANQLRIATSEREWFESRQAAPEQCFAAMIDDDSADLFGWVAGTMLFLRRPEFATLRVGDMTLVRTGTCEAPFETLVGRIGLSNEGDLVVTTNSANPQIAPTIIVRYAMPRLAGAAESMTPFRHRETELSYSALPSDRASIIGLIELPRPNSR